MIGLTKYPSTILVQRLDGTIYDLEKLDIRVLQFEPPSANYQHTMEQIGKYGKQFTETTIGERIIPFKVDVFATDTYDVVLQRQRLFDIFESNEDFYVYDIRQSALRWRVRSEQQPFAFYENYYLGGDISFNLICADGYAESVATSQTPFTYETESWEIGMNIPNGEDLHYSFSTPSFQVRNLSSIPILATERPYKIIFKGVAAGLHIKNTTTDQEFIFNKAIGSGDEFYLFGAWPFLNGSACYSDGNHQFIDLVKGINSFEISGYQQIDEISIDTHFYYG